MKTIKYTCDKCGAEITDVAYELVCWAEDVHHAPFGMSMEAANQNVTQNVARQKHTRHLCRGCKDAITDGVFIV